jgi:hypothetical protein
MNTDKPPKGVTARKVSHSLIFPPPNSGLNSFQSFCFRRLSKMFFHNSFSHCRLEQNESSFGPFNFGFWVEWPLRKAERRRKFHSRLGAADHTSRTPNVSGQKGGSCQLTTLMRLAPRTSGLFLNAQRSQIPQSAIRGHQPESSPGFRRTKGDKSHGHPTWWVVITVQTIQSPLLPSRISQIMRHNRSVSPRSRT